eukprot:XP_011682309.1 PREDICTED: paraneoplastic antigen Ma1-like [Strongylocentrotus purpuratus]
MAEYKANLLEPARALCKKEDIALDMAVLLIGDEVDDTTVDVDELLCAISEVVNCVQSAAVLERQPHCKSPSIALLLELDQKVSLVTLRDQDIHVPIRGTLTPFHLVLLAHQTKQTRRRVTLVEAREKRSATRSRVPEFSHQPGTMPREGQDHRLMKDFFNMSLHSNYRKLRPFSGSLSPSRDEDGFDLWVDQAEGQLQEWTAAGLEEVEKRRRISEALRPPASTIVRDLKLSKLQASAEDYISALEAAFGTTESGEEILLKFHDMAQHDQEKPSEFIMRLNSTLRRAVRKGGAPPDRADYLRLQKFIRSLYDEMLLVSLRLRDLLHDPPSFITLLSQVRRYEVEVAEKRQRRPVKGRSLQAVVESPTEPSNAMEVRLARLEQQMRDRGATSQDPVVVNAFQTPDTNKHPNFCYKCGEDGHFRRKCPNPPNLAAVNQKLIGCLSQGNAFGYQRRSRLGPESTQAPNKTYPPRQ